MGEYQPQMRASILQLLHDNGGQKTFVVAETPMEVFMCLLTLMVEGRVEHIPNDDSSVRTYRLKTKTI